MTNPDLIAGKTGTLKGFRGTSKEYAQALRLALQSERELWPEPQYTAHLCLINLVQNLIHELEEKETER